MKPIRFSFAHNQLTMSSADYCAYYDSQMGGAQLRVFRGGIQSGAGLGDILRGVLRFLVPVALTGLGSFAGRTLLGTQAGKTLGEAAKAAIGPSLGVMAQHAVPAASRLMGTYIPGLAPQSHRHNRRSSSLRSSVVVVPCLTACKVFQRRRRPLKSIKGRLVQLQKQSADHLQHLYDSTSKRPQPHHHKWLWRLC